MIILPEWSDPYMKIENNELQINLDISGEDKKFFTAKKEKIKYDCSKIKNWSHFSDKEMKILAQEYILCNLALATLEVTNARIAKENGTKPNGNDGTGRQHWLPECYIKSFSHNGMIKRIKKSDLSDEYLRTQKNNKKPRIGKLVNIKSDDFCESEKNRGKFYNPNYEIFLSKIESDYGSIDKNVFLNVSLWDFLVLSIFFLILKSRTLEMRETNHPIWHVKEASLVDVIPGIFSKIEMRMIHIKTVIPEELQKDSGNRVFLPFVQHPIYGNNKSLWCIFTPECLLWFVNKDFYKNKSNYPADFYTFQLTNILGNDDDRFLYFNPKHEYYWKLKSEII